MILLWLTGYILGLQFLSVFAKMGRWGCLVGYPIAMAYLGLLNSRLGKGQTLGKRLVQIRVVGEDGQFISPARSLLRTGLLVSAYLLSPLYTQPLSLSPFFVLYLLISAGLQVGAAYFYLFNRRTRQVLHDLVAHTCVVRDIPKGALSLPPVARVHYVISGGLTVLWVGFEVLLVLGARRWENLQGALLVQQEVRQFREVQNASVNFITTYEKGKEFIESVIATVGLKEQLACACSGEGPGGRSFFAGRPGCACEAGLGIRRVSGIAVDTGPDKEKKGYRYDPETNSPRDVLASPHHPLPCDCSREGQACRCVFQEPGCPCAVSAFANRVAGIVLDTYPNIDQKERLTVHLEYGYDIGITSGILPLTFRQTLSPAEWRERLEKR
jgi:uncharacterized RDD family membrane protein YckC